MTDYIKLEEMLGSLERRLVGVINHNSARQCDYEHKVDKLHSAVKIACNSIERRIEKLEGHTETNSCHSRTSPIRGYDEGDYKISVRVLKRLADLEKRIDSIENDYWEEDE